MAYLQPPPSQLEQTTMMKESKNYGALYYTTMSTVSTYSDDGEQRDVDGCLLSGMRMNHQGQTSLPSPPTVESSHKLSPQRWLVLASYCLLNGCNAWMWGTWSPITGLVADHWNVPESSVDALSGIYMYVFVPMNVLSMWLVVNHLGLARGLQVGAILNMMGALLRYGAAFLATHSNIALSEYQATYLGTFLCAMGQTFILPMIALLSGNWFGELERATATSLGVLASQTGTLLGLGSTAIVDFRTTDKDSTVLDPNKLDRYLQVQCLGALVALVLLFVNVTADRPPTPPSEAAALLAQQGRKGSIGVPYMESVHLTLSGPSSRRFFGVFGLAVGVFYALPTFLSQFMPGWPPQSQGLLGVIFQIAAVVGCSVTGRMVEYFELQYKKISLWLLSGCMFSTLLYLISVHFQSSLAMVACGGLGFFFSSFVSVGIEFGTALTYPADEAAVYGILDSTGELSGFLLVTIGGAMSSHTHRLDVWFCGILLAVVAAALILLLRLEGRSKRPSHNRATPSNTLLV